MDDPNSRDVTRELLDAYRIVCEENRIVIDSLKRTVSLQEQLIANSEKSRKLNERFLELDTGYRREIAVKDERIAMLERELESAKSMLGFDPTKRGSA